MLPQVMRTDRQRGRAPHGEEDQAPQEEGIIPPASPEDNYENVDALNDVLSSALLDRMRLCTDFDKYLARLQKRLACLLKKKLWKYRGVKIQVVVEAEFEKRTPITQDQTGDGATAGARRRRRAVHRYGDTEEPIEVEDQRQFVQGYLATSFRPVIHASGVDGVVQTLTEQLHERYINFVREGSGLVLRQLLRTEANFARYTPLTGSGFVELPPYLARKKAIVNVRNIDNRCFGYALLAALCPINNPQRPQSYENAFSEHHLDGLEYPIALDDLETVEQQIQIPFNVYSFFDDAGKGRYPVFLSRIDPDGAIDLLYWAGHYAWIKSFSRFMGSMNKHNGQYFYCKRCLNHFQKESTLATHQQHCMGSDGSTTVFKMPKAGTQVKFQHVRYQTYSPFVVYADFECLTIPIQEPGAPTPTCNMNPYQEHKPISVGLKLVSNVPSVLDNAAYETYTGADVVDWFLAKLIQYETMCTDYLFDEKRLVMTHDDVVKHERATECYICKYPFAAPNSERKAKANVKVRDHDHITGAYRGAAHSHCNLQLRRTYKVPVIIHNFRGYDSHLLVRAMGLFKDRQIQVIGQTMEKYLTMSWGQHIVFKDSLQFLNCSLNGLVECLRKSGRGKFTHLLGEFKKTHDDDAHIDLLLRKGVYPYDYMGSAERLQEKALPPRKAFTSLLRQDECSTEDYEHAQLVWKTFKCERFIDYHNLYLKCDVLLLADVFESFRATAMQNYGLDPAHYVSAPQLSWDAMLKMTECELELLSDPAMFRMVQENLRGGVAMISKRHAKANNKYMGDLYDATKPSSHILYLDANNLYGWSMSEPMAIGEFEWLTEEQISHIDWCTQSVDQSHGYIVECDIEYPKELHDLHSDYPLAPQRMTVTTDLLSTAQKETRAQYNMSSGKPATKLVPNLFDKERYVCHYRNLKFYIEHGLVLRKVHRVIRFRQSRWLAPYIAKNSALRAATTDEFEKTLWKLLNNSVFGKTCENVTKRSDIRLLTDSKKCETMTHKPHCLGHKIFSPDIAAVSMKKLVCAIEKPTYVGFVVLELAKLCMYEFHYDYALKRWPNGACKLLLTDTDSLVYEIQTDDVYADISAPDAVSRFDLSNYRNEFRNDTNKLVIGKMKDEAAGQIVCEVVALRPKMYSYKTLLPQATSGTHHFKESKRAKGIQRAAMEHVEHANYLEQLREPTENYVLVRRIGQALHNVYSFEFEKRGLCAFDDKRYLLSNMIDTLAHGHWRIAQQRSELTTALSQRLPTTSVQRSAALLLDDEGAAVVISDEAQHHLLPEYTCGEVIDSLAGCDPTTVFATRERQESFVTSRIVHSDTHTANFIASLATIARYHN